ncbi:phospho-N-acetylmuramoyl-pentapeptide-transferase [Patescibacteria group bacterium]|nr:phospho-N-acetylmuramoyl-pentapeptide-transferase [Patescibacteria group bacterium]MBU1015814.1 phospho-N-acetylmuramoyl-pentapeptide-transferase [Patescibacteria group bacterium]MBU1685233.1 phospho-N-acetylmuramoyl-pentapeptide-transferase [Patescibacteria group bacterium]MBU1938242.1 phospho-N-acetylmuramoyl-pentapeptide-transferase [Patescibacteria group bacterium]
MQIVPELIQVFGWSALTFMLTLLLTPIYLKAAKRFKLGKQIRENAMSGEEALIFREMHAKKTGTPTMGGVIMWGSVFLIIIFSRFLALVGLIDHSLLQRGLVYLPLFTLVAVGVLGAVDDWLNIRGIDGVKGIKARPKFLWLTLFAVLGAWWFYYKLGFSHIHIPSLGDFDIGLWYIPLFMLVIVSTANAVNITDGLDGLAGGLLILAFAAFGVIAFMKGQLMLAIFCGLMIGSLMAFLWNNVPPALYYMGDTGALAFGATLGVIAMMIDSLVVLIIVGAIFIVETLSVIIQLVSKKFFRKKVFLVAPLHHHFEKKGWGEAKITMRFWIIGAMLGVVGLIVGLLGMGIN